MRSVLRLRVSRELVRAELVRGGRVRWAGEARHGGPGDLSEAIAQLAAEPGLRPRPTRLHVELEPPVVQLRTLEGLPPVRESALVLLVANQASRFFRRNGKPLITDARWGRRGGPARGRAVAAAVEEPWVEAVLAGARSAGLFLERIGPPAPSRLILLTPDERRRRLRASVGSIARLGLVASALWLAVGVLAAARIYRERQRIDARLAAIAAPIESVRAARREIGEAARMLEAVAAAERERDSLAVHLAGIAAALPDSAYLGSLTLEAEGEGSLSGVARTAVGVVESLDRAAAVPGPMLDGPAVRERHGGADWERFTIRFGRRSGP